MTPTTHGRRPASSVLGDLVATVRVLPGFSEISAESREALLATATPRCFEKGEALLEEGQRSASLFLLVEGRLKMSRLLAGGREALLALFGPGDVVGTVAAISDRESVATIEALEPSACLEISRGDLLACFEAQPRRIGELLPMLTRQLVECRNCIIEATFFRVEGRLAMLFLELADTVGESRLEGTFVPIPLTRREIASMTGTTVETAIRILSRWGKGGVVETAADGFLVRDRGALEELAAG